ncbi:MAG: ThiF family adenylyltransferase [Candidatus Caldarchaeum sp.]|nr:ThiF family adenylyltransferase [Candidatus Caldarchaeum sp.]
MDAGPALARYDRQLRLDGWEQHRLTAAKVLVAGVGALGCETAKNLALMGVGELLLVDNDNVELSNLSRQMLYVDEDIGKPKAELAQQRVSKMNPHVQVVGVQTDVRHLPVEVFSNFDVFVSCVDNWPTRRWINSMAVELGKPLVDIASDGYYGNVQPVLPRKTACIECHAEALIPTEVQAAECSLRRRKPEDLVLELREKDIIVKVEEAAELFQHNIKTLYDIKYAPQKVVDGLSPELRSLIHRLRSLLNPKIPAVLSVAATVAGLGVFEVVRILHGGSLGKALSGLLVYDGLSGRVSRVKLGRNPLCHVCGVDIDNPTEIAADPGEKIVDLIDKISNKFMFPDVKLQKGTRLLYGDEVVRDAGLRDGDILYVHTSRRASPMPLKVRVVENSD